MSPDRHGDQHAPDPPSALAGRQAVRDEASREPDIPIPPRPLVRLGIGAADTRMSQINPHGEPGDGDSEDRAGRSHRASRPVRTCHARTIRPPRNRSTATLRPPGPTPRPP